MTTLRVIKDFHATVSDSATRVALPAGTVLEAHALMGNGTQFLAYQVTLPDGRTAYVRPLIGYVEVDGCDGRRSMP